MIRLTICAPALTAGDVVIWPGGRRQTAATVTPRAGARGRQLYAVAFAENEATAAPALFAEDDTLTIEREAD